MTYNMRFITLITLINLVLLSSCKDDNALTVASHSEPLLSRLSSEQTGIKFSNTIKENVNRNIISYDYYYNGGGVAVGDINNDGLDDILFSGNTVSNQLYLNKGNLQFENITEAAGLQSIFWSTGVTMVDINNDGYLDIYVCNSAFGESKYRINQLYINQGNLKFIEQAEKYGLADAGYSSQASFTDFDKDGDLDLLLMNHSVYQGMNQWKAKMKSLTSAQLNHHSIRFYQNNGDNTFTDFSDKAGISKPAFGLGLITSDLNHDGWTDIYITNDYYIPDFLFINNKDGTFREEINKRTGHLSFYSMGADAADFNNDGLLDLSVVDMTPSDHKRNKLLMASMNVKFFRRLTETDHFQSQYMFNMLQVNRGKGQFSNISLATGLSHTDWSWTTLFTDLDNDGLKDIFITNGFKRDTKDNDWINGLREIQKQPKSQVRKVQEFQHLSQAKTNPIRNFIYKNNGNYDFQDVSEKWGIDEATLSNGASYSDLDNDGDLDLIINNIDQEAFIYKNNTQDLLNNNYIQIELLEKDNQVAYNSKVTIYQGKNIQFAELHPVRGYWSSSQTAIHFGLGKAHIDSLRIEWNDGKQTLLSNLQVNKKHQIFKDKSQKISPKNESGKSLFKEVNNLLDKNFKHKENDYDDFANEILLPHKQSMLGPFIAIGDVNNDQLEDFYIGGAKNQSGALYIQNQSGTFSISTEAIWHANRHHEDMGSTFLDYDLDGDQDLYISSGGGGAFQNDDSLLQDRLYNNDGKGHFSLTKNIIPPRTISSGRVTKMDYDNDGYVDLFIAGRTYPGRYPFPVSSAILKNLNGKYKDVTSEVAPQLIDIGMVTDAVWSDFDGDKLVDLILVGEWMPITFLKNMGSTFKDVSDQMGQSKKIGWWKSITHGDFDNDGDDDYVVGNIGINNKFHPTEEKPLHIFCDDFDSNGTYDIVLSKEYESQLVPVRGKECSSSQMPFIKEKFPTYKEFSEASIIDLYGEEKLDHSLHYTANHFESIYLENINGSNMKAHPLPIEAQMSPINSIYKKDINGDNNLDLIIAGNDFHTEVETPKYDAGKGLYLLGLGNGRFETSFNTEDSGLNLPLNVKDIKAIRIGEKQENHLIIANNNDILQFVNLQH